MRALENFTGAPAEYLEAYYIDDAAAGWQLGELAQINYIATRDGQTFEFEHRFRERSRPLLVASADGDMLLILGGGFRVTDQGIVDR